jgi:hypothetical protein
LTIEPTSPHVHRIAADKSRVETRVTVLRQLVRDSLYAVDERAIADAIVLRARARMLIAAPSFRSEVRRPPVRSFRRNRDARSFRLIGSPRLRHVDH